MLRHLLCASLTFGVTAAAHTQQGRGDVHRFPLISAAKNYVHPTGRIDEKSLKSKSPVPAWSVSLRTLHGGKQEGVQLITLDNGKMQIVLIPTRGMGILRVIMGDVILGWKSPVTEVVHPKHVNLTLRGGLGWLEGFNEWLARCEIGRASCRERV